MLASCKVCIVDWNGCFVMDAGLQALLEKFIELGGISENICQRDGEFGRGVFPVDSTRKVKIMTPRNLLVDSNNLSVHGGEIVIKDKTSYSIDEIVFLESYYNDYSWGNNGNSDAAAFLKYVASLSEPIKKQLLDYGFVDVNFLNTAEYDDCLLKRFVSERAVTFDNRSVLAPVWEFVNHSSFVPPLRVTPHGVETPPISPGPGEILFKYSGKNSSMSMWKKYGFACSCIVSYSIPFTLAIENHSTQIRCSGQLGLDPNELHNFSIQGNNISIKSLPVGCISASLPFENFQSKLLSFGLSTALAKILFQQILELNIKARHYMLESLQEFGAGGGAELFKALTYETELIQRSLS